MNKNILIILLGLSFLVSCASTGTCPRNPAEGNISSPFNSDNDEYSPYFYENTFYYTISNKTKKIKETLYRSEFVGGRFQRPEEVKDLPFENLQNASLPTFCINPNTGNIEVWFSANTKNGKIHRNLFFAEKIGENWSKPQNAKFFNTENFESHPFISSDGKVLIFSSDRPGGKGGLDLYVATRDERGNWSSPRNLTEINTESNELTPFIAPDGTLYFASQGYSKQKNYDIIKAQADGIAKWSNPRPMPAPINTDFDETGPAIFKGKIFFSSNRPQGCGGKDIYAFDLCGPAKIECVVISRFPSFPVKGTAYLFDEENNPVSTKSVDGAGLFEFDLVPNKNYRVKYVNECNEKYSAEQIFNVPCSDSSTVVIRAMFEFNPTEEFDLIEVKVPFFVTGYYQPNTKENLEALRLKFAYNLIGIDEKTQYIEKPGEIYDKYAEEVEKALSEAAEKLYNVVSLMDNECVHNPDFKIQIKMIGYADPRSISSKAIFPDADIDDEKFGIKVQRGTKMDNQLLSLLRAYYTAKYFEKYIENRNHNLSQKIVWIIEGKGVDKSDLPDKNKRRVNIKIMPL